MVGRVIADLVDTLAVAVEGQQLGAVAVGLKAPLGHLRRSCARAKFTKPKFIRCRRRPLRKLAGDGLAKRAITGEQIALGQRRRLVGDAVGRELRQGAAVRHAEIVSERGP